MAVIPSSGTFQRDTSLTDVPPGIPIKADGGGITLHLPTVPPTSYVGLVLYNTKASYPVDLWVGNLYNGLISGKSYWAQIYNNYPGYTSSYVYIASRDLSDPYITSDHAVGDLNYANILLQVPINGNSSGEPLSFHYPSFVSGPNGMFYIINIVPNIYGISATITGVASRILSDGSIVPEPINTPIINQGNIVIFVNINQTVDLTLTNNNSQGINTTVYMMEPNLNP